MYGSNDLATVLERVLKTYFNQVAAFGKRKDWNIHNKMVAYQIMSVLGAISGPDVLCSNLKKHCSKY